MSHSASETTAENATNLSEIEKQWSVKAMQHAEVYFKLINQTNPSTLRLTRIDDEIYTDFRNKFPDMNVEHLSSEDINANSAIKEQWRAFLMPYQKRVAHFNFGTLLRMNASEDYTEDNSYFVTRMQFYAIEIARNKEAMKALSDLLATGLNHDMLEACVELCELGINPEALAALVKELSAFKAYHTE